MKKLTELFLVVALVLLFSTPALSMPQGPANIDMGGQTMPKVEFSHEAHKGYAGDCKACHHLGVGTGSCTDCHGGDSRFVGKKRAFHQSCKGCHAERGVSGRRDCDFCHKD